MNSLVVLAKVVPIFILRDVYINFCGNFLHWKNQFLPRAILRVVLSWSTNADVLGEKK